MQIQSVLTIPMSKESKELREWMKKQEKASCFDKKYYPFLLNFISNRGKVAFPEMKQTFQLNHCVIKDNDIFILGNEDAPNTILYLHGGAYVFGIDPMHITFCDKMAHRLNAKVIIPLYTPAPQGSYKETYELLDELYETLLGNRSFYIMGDSSGGGLALAYAQYLKEKQQDLPEKIVLISPWVDITMSNPDIEKMEVKDLKLHRYALIEFGKLWSDGLDTKHPLVSPLYGNLEGLPSVMLFTGTDEVMFPDVTLLYTKLKAVKNDARLILGDGLWHIFPLNEIPEREAAIDIIEAFCLCE